MRTSTTIGWLPRPAFVERKQVLQDFVETSPSRSIARLSEFLSEENILFFSGDETKIQVVETLVGTFQQRDPQVSLQAIWSREREGALRIQPDISIVRGRLEGIHHIRAALGICPKGVFDPSNACGMTRAFVLFVGPATQTRLHLGLLVAVSALFHDRTRLEQFLKIESAKGMLAAIQQAEDAGSGANFFQRAVRRVTEFLSIHYGWGMDGSA